MVESGSNSLHWKMADITKSKRYAVEFILYSIGNGNPLQFFGGTHIEFFTLGM